MQLLKQNKMNTIRLDFHHVKLKLEGKLTIKCTTLCRLVGQWSNNTV